MNAEMNEELDGVAQKMGIPADTVIHRALERSLKSLLDDHIGEYGTDAEYYTARMRH